MTFLDDRTLSDIFEAYSRLHPAMRGRASWRMGVEAWQALRREPRMKDAVVATPEAMTFCGIPVLIGSSAVVRQVQSWHAAQAEDSGVATRAMHGRA